MQRGAMKLPSLLSALNRQVLDNTKHDHVNDTDLAQAYPQHMQGRACLMTLKSSTLFDVFSNVDFVLHCRGAA